MKIKTVGSKSAVFFVIVIQKIEKTAVKNAVK